jgi:hypothetical protein
MVSIEQIHGEWHLDVNSQIWKVGKNRVNNASIETQINVSQRDQI